MQTEPTIHWLTADDVLSPYIYVFYAAFVVSFIFTPIMRQVATYYGIDRPARSHPQNAQGTRRVSRRRGGVSGMAGGSGDEPVSLHPPHRSGLAAIM